MPMSKLEGDDRPTYILGYARWVRWVRLGMAILLVGVALLRWIVAWVAFVRPLVHAASVASSTSAALGQVLIATLAAQPLRPLVAAHLGLVLVAGAVAFLFTLLPDLSLADQGLAVRTIRGWRVVPWTTITVVRIMSWGKADGRLVLIQGRWARWSVWPRLVSICLGAGAEPGVLLTSAIRDFKPLMLRLYQEVNKAAPAAVFDDKFLSPSASLVLEPGPTLAGLVEDARGEGWPFAVSAQVMGAVPAGLVLVQLLMLIREGGVWWKPIAIVALCEMEWLIGSFYLFALAEILPAYVEFREAALLYPAPQLPRALLSVPMAMFVAAGAPFLAAMLGLAGVLWAVVLTALLVQEIYRLESILPAMIGGAFQALFQFLVLAIVFSG
jgi:hypothetical protein